MERKDEFQQVGKVLGMGTLVCKDNKYGLMDDEGEVLVPCEMDAIDFYVDLNLCFLGKGAFFGMYSAETGFIPPIYDEIFPDAEQVEVIFQGKQGYLNSDHEFVPCQQDTLSARSYSLREEILLELNEKLQRGTLTELGDERIYRDELHYMVYHKDGAYVLRAFGGHFE